MNGKRWLMGWVAIVCTSLGIIGGVVYRIDPYIHFHKPDTESYFYVLNNERSQNDGISKYFDYDAMITGTSMTENFKSSELNEVFGCNSIKVPYSGGSYKEINDSVKVAIDSNPDLKMVIRGLDMERFTNDKDLMRSDLGDYPIYLYDENPLNDVQYLWNRDIIWNKIWPMLSERNKEDFKPGITSFDDYSRWQDSYTFGKTSIYPGDVPKTFAGEPVRLSGEEKTNIEENITQNVTSIAKENPNITFYYFITPYSVAWWGQLVSSGTIYSQIEAEEYAIKLILECDNIKLFSFNNRMDITTDLNNYKDKTHYGEWVNSLILRWMYNGDYQLTRENYKNYLKEELNNYLYFDYDSLNRQADYENDSYAAALVNKELKGVDPVDILETYCDDLHLNRAILAENQYDNKPGIDCVGSVQRKADSKISVYKYLLKHEYIGAKVSVPDADDYGYLVFYGRKVADYGQPTVYIIDDTGKKVGSLAAGYYEIDNEWHQYVIDIKKAMGSIQIIFNGGYIDNTGSPNAEYIFSKIVLY